MAPRHEYRNPCRRRDLVVRPVFDVGQQHYLALNRRELSERRKQPSAKICSLESPNRRIRPLGRQRLLERNESLAPNRPNSVERPPMHDREQPRCEPIRLSAGSELFVCVHEGLLRDVVGVSGVAKNGESTRERGAAMPTHQRLERVLFTRQRALNQYFVGQLGGHAVNRTPAGDEA